MTDAAIKQILKETCKKTFEFAMKEFNSCGIISDEEYTKLHQDIIIDAPEIVVGFSYKGQFTVGSNSRDVNNYDNTSSFLRSLADYYDSQIMIKQP